MWKRKEGHFSNQTTAFSLSFVAIVKVKHDCVVMVYYQMKKKEKLTLIKLISSMIPAASKEQILSEFKRSTSSARLHSTITFEKLVTLTKQQRQSHHSSFCAKRV